MQFASRCWQWTLVATLGWIAAEGRAAAQQAIAPGNAADSANDPEPLAQRSQFWDDARRHAAAGDLAQAIAAAEGAQALEVELFGKASAEVAFTWGWIGEQQLAQEAFAAAVAALQRREEILAALPAIKPWQLVDARRAVADAQQLAQLPEDLRKKLAEATALNRTVVAKYHQGDFQGAVQAAKQARQLREAVLGDDHPATAMSLNNLAGLYESLGQYDAARPLYEQALVIRKSALGEDHPETATALNNLAGLCVALGEYGRARELFERALAIRQEALGDEHPDTALSLNNLAFMYTSLGEPRRALPLYEQALAIRQRTVGEQHSDTAVSLNNLAFLYESVGEYARALPLYEQALAIRKQVLGQQHPDTAVSLNNLAGLYESMGEPARALPLYEQALAIRKQALGGRHPDVAMALNNLAYVYTVLGDYERAQPLYRQAMAIRREALGDEHPDTAVSLNNLASLYVSAGDHVRAATLYEQTLEIRQRTLGEEHPDTAAALNNLAFAYASMGDEDRALPLYEQALAIRKRVLGEQHPDVAATLNNIARLYESKGDYPRARKLYRQALAICRKSLGDEHAATAATLNNLAAVLAAAGYQTEAAQAFLDAAAVQRRSLEKQLFALSDEQTQLSLSVATPTIALLASLPSQTFRHPESVAEAMLSQKAIAFEVLNRRGLAKELVATDPAAAQLQSKLATVHGALEELSLAAPAALPADEQAARRRHLHEQSEELEEQLNRKLAAALGADDASLEVDIARIRERMVAESALVDLFCYKPYDFAAAGDRSPWGEARYLAVVVPQNQSRQVELIDLGAAEQINRLVEQLGQNMRRCGRYGASGDEQALENEYREIAAELYAKLLKPLRESLGDARCIYLGPDSRLHEISLETLVGDDGRYLIESGYEFAYLNGGRDLQRPPAAQAGDGVSVFAGPNYDLTYEQRAAAAANLLSGSSAAPDAAATNASADPVHLPDAANDSEASSRGVETRSGWRHLPGADLEGEEAAVAFAAGDFGPVEIYTGDEALEELIKRIRRPRVLVLVTHGDFLEDLPPLPATPGVGRDSDDSADPSKATAPAEPSASGVDRGGARSARSGLRASRDPMLRSYLVFAGANKLDELPPGANLDNGWLTAQEISQLDLRGTDLVVLSACNTSRGAAENGQAVVGMRSAFLFAGARTIVGSLYAVPNIETRELMRPFYERVAAGQAKLAALNAAKLQFIQRRRETEGAAHPFYWASFILVGEP